MSRVLQKKLDNLLDTGELFELVDNTCSTSDLLRRLGYSDKGQYIKLVKEFLASNDVDFSHWRQGGNKSAVFLEKTCPVCSNIFFTNEKTDSTTCSYSCANTHFRSGENNPNYTNGTSANRIPNRLYRDVAYRAYGYICNRCSFDNSLALQVHHKDRNRLNNDLSNLEVLCSNCHSIEHRLD